MYAYISVHLCACMHLCVCACYHRCLQRYWTFWELELKGGCEYPMFMLGAEQHSSAKQSPFLVVAPSLDPPRKDLLIAFMFWWRKESISIVLVKNKVDYCYRLKAKLKLIIFIFVTKINPFTMLQWSNLLWMRNWLLVRDNVSSPKSLSEKHEE